MKKLFAAALAIAGMASAAQADVINFLYTSDNHYGITRPIFEGQYNVSAQTVNEAMIDSMNNLKNVTLPNDGGVNAGQLIGNSINFLVDTGDLANRTEYQAAYTGSSFSYLGSTVTTQSQAAYMAPVSATTWGQFQSDFLGMSSTTNISGADARLQIKDNSGQNIPLYLSPGNHDVNDAIGYVKSGSANAIDTTSYVQIYNRMIGNANGTTMTPGSTAITYSGSNLINYSVNVGGVHMMFVNMFPAGTDIVNWMNQDLAGISSTTPVLLFSHVPLNMADTETKVFGNPLSPTSTAAGDIPITGVSGSTQLNNVKQSVADWLMAHPNVKACFSGHDNFNGATTWNGQNSAGTLINPTTDGTWGGVELFRVDSPMKGDYSGVSSTNGVLTAIGDETQLSYQLYSYDTTTQQLTERPYYWDPTGVNGAAGIWGSSVTVDLAVVPEPSTYAMMGVGAIALLGMIRRRKRA